ncbi:MAG: surface lipoprotein assembly modifier [Rhodospirillales bacterium]|nr:surface lipoprotein assembly modifier [Rhodospirillales bacterium]
MPGVSLCRALALAFCLAAATPCGGALAAPAAPPPAELTEARALVRAGKPEAALAILRPLARGRTVDAAVLFEIGIAAIVASQRPGIDGDSRDALLDEAIGALHAMLVGRPGLIRVRLELARAFFLKQEDALARRHFEQVLAGKPPAGVALNVNRFLNIMRARKRWSLRVGASMLPDTNIGAGSAERIIYINVGGARLPFRRDVEELTTSGIGVSAWLGGEYQYPVAPQWRLRGGGDVSRREYRESRFDRMTVSGHVGPRWLIGRGSEASLLLTGLHQWTGSGLKDPSHYDVGVRVEGRHRLTPRTTLTARISRAERRYDDEDNRDGPILDVSLGTFWVASPTLRLDAGLGWGRERPELERFRNASRRLHVGATAALPWGFTVGGSGALRWTDWEGSWLPFVEGGGERRDLTRTIRVFAHNRALTVEGFSPQISVTQESRTTNAQLHDYERTFGEVRFVRLF